MQAMIKTQAAPGLDFTTVEDPVPGPHDVVIKVKVVAVCGGDKHIYDWNEVAQGLKLGLPFIPGHEVAGEIVEVGPKVQGFDVGDRISVETHIPCTTCRTCRNGQLHLCDNLKIFGVGTDGAFADYAVVPAVVAFRLPDEVSDEQGSILEPLGVAVHAVERSGLGAGDSVAVLGCGPIGLFSIAVARLSGAVEIIATDVSDYRLDLAHKAGATHTLNAGRDDIARAVGEITGGTGVDNIFESSASPQALEGAFEILAKRGRLMAIGAHMRTAPLDFLNHVTLKESSVMGVFGREIWGTWHKSAALLGSGALDATPIITHRFPLSEIEEAFRIAKRGEAGKILLIP